MYFIYIIIIIQRKISNEKKHNKIKTILNPWIIDGMNHLHYINNKKSIYFEMD